MPRELSGHDRDPIGRQIVAQAAALKMALLPGDSSLRRYGIPVLW